MTLSLCKAVYYLGLVFLFLWVILSCYADGSTTLSEKEGMVLLLFQVSLICLITLALSLPPNCPYERLEVMRDCLVILSEVEEGLSVVAGSLSINLTFSKALISYKVSHLIADLM